MFPLIVMSKGPTFIMTLMMANTELRRKDMEVTDIDEIKNILNACKTASVAMIDENMPYVVPLSYG